MFHTRDFAALTQLMIGILQALSPLMSTMFSLQVLFVAELPINYGRWQEQGTISSNHRFLFCRTVHLICL